MTRLQKNDIVDDLTSEFKTASAIIVSDYRGTSHKELESLRVKAKELNVNVRIVKNSLVKVSLKNIENIELPAELTGPSIFIWSEDQIAACKTAYLFSKEVETFSIKTGIVENKIADLDTINALAQLPGKDELLGMLGYVWTAPIRNFTVGLDALKQKKEEEAA
jgi:large subunit ribosomal protein L10